MHDTQALTKEQISQFLEVTIPMAIGMGHHSDVRVMCQRVIAACPGSDSDSVRYRVKAHEYLTKVEGRSNDPGAFERAFAERFGYSSDFEQDDDS